VAFGVTRGPSEQAAVFGSVHETRKGRLLKAEVVRERRHPESAAAQRRENRS
jgi:hypothetical protein